MQEEMEKMWAAKLGLDTYDAALFKELAMLMMQTSVDYTLFFRELSHIPEDITPLTKSFYKDVTSNENILKSWSEWLEKWKSLIHATTPESTEKLSNENERCEPKVHATRVVSCPCLSESQQWRLHAHQGVTGSHDKPL